MKHSSRKPAFASYTPRFIKGMLSVNLLFVVSVAVYIGVKVGKGATESLWSLLLIWLVFVLNAAIFWRALRHALPKKMK